MSWKSCGIAEQLVVTLDTVKKYITHLLGKLGAANRTEAVARARQLGLIPTGSDRAVTGCWEAAHGADRC